MTAPSSTQRTTDGYLRENYDIHGQLANDIPDSHCHSAIDARTGDEVVVFSFWTEKDMRCLFRWLSEYEVLEYFVDEKERGGSHHLILSASVYEELVERMKLSSSPVPLNVGSSAGFPVTHTEIPPERPMTYDEVCEKFPWVNLMIPGAR